MVEVLNLHKKFGPVTAVERVSLTAKDGQITAILGANGAGKSTTLAAICGAIGPDDGSIRIHDASGGVGAKRCLGSVLDHHGLYDRLTAREHIEYFGRLQGLRGDQLRTATTRVIETFGLGAIASRRVSGFSQGERMKVLLARALVHEPKNIVLDEPTNGLDLRAVHAMRDWLRLMRAGGRCVIFSSHIVDDVRALCDEVVVLVRGRVAAAGTIAALSARYGRGSFENALAALLDQREEDVCLVTC